MNNVLIIGPSWYCVVMKVFACLFYSNVYTITLSKRIYECEQIVYGVMVDKDISSIITTQMYKPLAYAMRRIFLGNRGFKKRFINIIVL